MCGRFTVLTRDEIVQLVEDIQTQRESPLTLGDARELRMQARPGSLVDAIVPAGSTVDTVPMTWGLQPPWSKKLVFNTRIESALGESPLWQRAIREGRCILPAATFFEANTVHALDDGADGENAAKAGIASAIGTTDVPGAPNAKPRAFEFAMPDNSPCLLASVFEKDRVSVVTTEPNARVAHVHNRMPLVLRFEEVETWLRGDLANLAELADRRAFELVRIAERNRIAKSTHNPNSKHGAGASMGGQLTLFD